VHKQQKTFSRLARSALKTHLFAALRDD